MYIEDIFRKYWAVGINNITVNKSEGFNTWVKTGKDYQINKQVLTNEFEIQVFDRTNLLIPISKDCNRFSTAALESIMKIDDLLILPKNISWLLIKQYYAAFYAAHLILRYLGFSLSQFDNESIRRISEIADLYGNLNNVKVEQGYYIVDYSSSGLIATCKKININQDGGSHVALWKFFGEKIKYISLDCLNKFDSSEVQPFVVKLDQLLQNLSYVGSNNYSWLSRMRNDFNYKHLYGIWHPYTTATTTPEIIINNLKTWRKNINNIELNNLTGKEILRFSNTCLYIVGLSNEISKDMARRCSNGKSFLNAGHTIVYNNNK